MTARNASGRRSADGSGATDCITLMNIDNFRLVNERLGHDVGDAVLAEVGRRLHRVVRDTDMLVRWGGEEFLVFSPNAHPQQMRMMLERVMNAVGSTPMQVEVHSIPVTISAGLACVPFAGMPEDEFDWQKVVSLADKALHHAKRQGRNRAVAVADLKADEGDAMAAIDADFPDAVAQGLVEVMQVAGPAGGAAQANAAGLTGVRDKKTPANVTVGGRNSNWRIGGDNSNIVPAMLHRNTVKIL